MNELTDLFVFERSVPLDVIGGLASKEYSLHGGVVRYAAGTGRGGQIVRHLVPVDSPSLPDLAGSVVGGPPEAPGALQNAFAQVAYGPPSAMRPENLQGLPAATAQILAQTSATMVLSGLNLAVTAVSFIVLNKKLNKIDGKLDEIQKDVKEIRAFLERDERARLKNALRNLTNIDITAQSANRHSLLHNAHDDLGVLYTKYAELLAGAETLEAAVVYEEFFSVTALAWVRCAAELDELGLAVHHFRDVSDVWHRQARRIARDLCLRDTPERFMAGDFVEDAPITALGAWLDFVHDEERGTRWIDELRAKPATWKLTDLSPTRLYLRGSEAEQDKNVVVPTLHKLTQRRGVYEGYHAQLEALRDYDVTPSEFERRLLEVPEEERVGGYLILRPTIHSKSRREAQKDRERDAVNGASSP